MMNLKDKIRIIEDYPMPGVSYRDLTTLLSDPQGYQELIARMEAFLKSQPADLVAAPEARGFALGAPIAYVLGAGFIPIRRAGRLPGDVLTYEYPIEQGRTDVLEIHKDAIRPGQRIVIVDDLLATGSTALAACHLLEEAGARISALCFAMEMTMHGGRDRLMGYEVYSAIKY